MLSHSKGDLASQRSFSVWTTHAPGHVRSIRSSSGPKMGSLREGNEKSATTNEMAIGIQRQISLILKFIWGVCY